MIRKTYGVSGLMDWTTQIKAGKATINVHFSGGALTAYGVTPATYSTTNLFFQTVIENSDHFKNGRIKLIGQMEVAEDAATKKRKLPVSTVVKQPTEDSVKLQPLEVFHETKDEPLQDKAPDGRKTVEVADKSDAIEYLKEKFPDKGYGAVKLRTKSAFDAACQEHGIEFVFTA